MNNGIASSPAGDRFGDHLNERLEERPSCKARACDQENPEDHQFQTTHVSMTVMGWSGLGGIDWPDKLWLPRREPEQLDKYGRAIDLCASNSIIWKRRPGGSRRMLGFTRGHHALLGWPEDVGILG
jgi:hypothetical protein